VTSILRCSARGVPVALALAVGILCSGPLPAAWGHAAGPVPQARLSAEGNRVHLVWTAAEDDAAAIGAVVGVFPREVSYAYLEGDEQGMPSQPQIAAFSRSAVLRTYLLEHVAVVQAGVPCPGEVEPAEDFIADGARFTFTCPDRVRRAEVTVGILLDDDPTYRTFSVDGTERFAMHTAGAPTHEWDFTASQVPSSDGLPTGSLTGAEPALLALVDASAGGLLVTLLALLTAAGVGALHALGPGHGKAVIGAYLAGSQGRPRDALALGGLVAVMHSASVLALGSALYLTQRVPGGDALEPTLRLASAAMITAVGIGLLRRALRHRHATAGALRPRHHHAPAEPVAPLSRPGILALATAGGLLPSPAAFLVLSAAFAVGRSGFGLSLVAAFSLGLAAMLTGIGLAIVSGREAMTLRAEHRPALRRLARSVPMASAVIVVVGGLALAGSAVRQLV
jgi:nickel/cobalt transporter (NicO) family protein